MDKAQVREAIDAARKGIEQYLWLLRSLHRVDVTKDRNFQKRYNAFYRVRQRPPEWYKVYFGLLESQKRHGASFDEILEMMWEKLGRYEPSFSSKLVATIDPMAPIWDKFVLKNTGLKAPPYTDPDKGEKAKIVYREIREWYDAYLASPEGQEVIAVFRQEVPEHEEVTDIKKGDFVLWQTRA
jgi:hypothetical protein